MRAAQPAFCIEMHNLHNDALGPIDDKAKRHKDLLLKNIATHFSRAYA
jgi:hypothetical protein